MIIASSVTSLSTLCPSVRRSVCHNFLKRQGSYTSMLLTDHLLLFWLYTAFTSLPRPDVYSFPPWKLINYVGDIYLAAQHTRHAYIMPEDDIGETVLKDFVLYIF